MNMNDNSTKARSSMNDAADTKGENLMDLWSDFVGLWYDEDTWGVAEMEVKRYVPTRLDLYLLAREHAGDALHFDFFVRNGIGGDRQDTVEKKAYAKERLWRISRLIGRAMTDRAIRSAVQLACRSRSGEYWEEYVQKRLRWLPSPWGLGESDPPPDAWLYVENEYWDFPPF